MDNSVLWTPGMTLDQMERLIILKAFTFYRQNKTATAKALNISIRTLDNKFEKYAFEDKEMKEREDADRKRREEFIARSKGNVQVDPKTGASVYGPPNGLHMESTPKLAAEQDMPMPKRKEVQEMLPGQTAKSHSGKSRR